MKIQYESHPLDLNFIRQDGKHLAAFATDEQAAECLIKLNAYDDLLEALKAFMSTDPTFCTTSDECLDKLCAKSGPSADLAKIVRQARAAIQKAGAA